MKFKSKILRDTIGAWADIYAAIPRGTSIFDLRDLPLFFASVVSLTLIICSCTFYIYSYFHKDPFVLTISIAILSVLFSFVLILLFRINFSRRAASPNDDKLVQNLPEVASIRKEMVFDRPSSNMASTMGAHYPAGLIRIFAVAVSVACVGLVALVIGLITNSSEVQFGGSTVLAVGFAALTLAVLHGENLDRQTL